MKIKNIIPVIILALMPQLLSAQFVSDVSKRGTTAAPFLNISQGARAAGMGSAFVAVADDPSAIFWNPAGLARLNNHGVTFDHTLWFADIGYNFGTASFNLGDFGVLGASFIASDIDEMNVTTITEPNGTGETFNVRDMAFSIAWAFNLTDNFSIGFNPKVVYQGIWKMSDYAFAIDFGVLYNTPFDGITLGMAITNFGSKMSLSGTSAVVLYDEDIQNTGNNGRIPAELEMESWDLPLGFKVGVSYRPFKLGDHDIILSIDASHPNNNYESINVGGEYTFNNIFSIRGGYKSLFLEDSEESFSLGAGFQQKLLDNVSIKFDYAYADFGRLDNIQKFSIGILF
ncbi:MAG: PorV/PorQ family protein [Ignavibacteriae bacterium]|nr:PorV/PorQ family protein [Ignavibacteriota bacterium]MCB9206438.1 PorV/PorQ family protein [Ignavibacteriales bacterium]MCB9210690.1 PorV/PorQ family protein [Ignavibacteriales bacterium]MCB9219651.1 PorV/PorQ family protein [Ignavibacteriales bacterium]MCB9259961.1 PorV/PorQ family protein [Ignavibacteriales bacterium]